MSDDDRCRVCGSPLSKPAEGLAFCPSCLLQEGLTAGSDEIDPDDASVDPESVGPYRIVRRLGEGGMGVVYLAEQSGELRRQVAVKLIKLGVNSRQVLARFRMEQQSLALMDHRSIAKIFDAGTAADGQPYFVMEYVDGTTLTRYCDEKRLTNVERIRLFLDVCQGVQHAHQRGVIHRDLKPSNLLVAESDEGPQVKIIDFGVAKATEKRFMEWSVFTEIGKLVGTPVYMSPEQAGLSEQAVDTRSDVYSLGVVLYELLVGTTPLDESSLREAGLRAILETVQKASFPTPSSRAESLGDASEQAAVCRSTSAGALTRQLRGELDWIVMRALDRDKDRRFRSPAELADDLRRFLEDEPVESGPPSAWYRLTKLVRRHAVAFAMTATLIAALVVAVVGVSLGLVRAQRAEAEARQQAAIAEATNRFLNEDLLEAVAPEMEGRDVKVIDLIDRAGEQIETRFPDSPRTRAAIHRTVGVANTSLGRLEQAGPHLERALELQRTAAGEDDPLTAQLMCELGAYQGLAGRPEDGLELARTGLAILERLPEVPAERLIAHRREVALLTAWAGDTEASFEQLQLLLPDARAELGERHEETITLLNDLSNAHARRRELEAAEALAVEAVSLQREVFGPEHAYTLVMEANLAALRVRQRRYEAAVEDLDDLLPRFRALFGDDHPRTLTVLSYRAVALGGLERHEEAAAAHLELIERRSATLGPTHRSTISSHYSYARAQNALKNYALAAEHFGIAFERRLETLGPTHLQTIFTESQLADAEARTGRLQAALARHESALAKREHVLDHQGYILAAAQARYGNALLMAGRREDAKAAFRAALSTYDALPAERAAERTAERAAVAKKLQALLDGEPVTP